MTDDVVFAWGTMQGGEPAAPPTVSVSAWPALLGTQWIRDVRDERLYNAEIAFVNLFHTSDSIHIQRIKERNPACYVVAMPDAPVEVICANAEIWPNVFYQLSQADAIAGRTQADCDVYGALFNKPSYYFPSPIGPDDFFAPFWDTPKEDYVISLDHSFAIRNTTLNVAALAVLQRKTGCRIIYAAERDWTPFQAKLAGLDVEFRGYVNFFDFVELTAKAKLCVDMYAAHSYGRQAVLCGMVGTPCVTSFALEDAPGVHINEYTPYAAARQAQAMLDSETLWNHVRARSRAAVKTKFSFDACRRRAFGIIEQIKKAQAIRT